MQKLVLKYLVVGTIVVLLAGCTEAVLAPRLGSNGTRLATEWIAPPDDIGPVGWYQKRLTLATNGRFTATSSSYGLYEGQQRNDPSAWTRIEGSYRVDGNRIEFTPETMTWWDHFESATHPAPRQSAYPWGTLFDDATFLVKGDTLTLGFNVYPADAAVPVTVRYARQARD